MAAIACFVFRKADKYAEKLNFSTFYVYKYWYPLSLIFEGWDAYD